MGNKEKGFELEMIYSLPVHEGPDESDNQLALETLTQLSQEGLLHPWVVTFFKIGMENAPLAYQDETFVSTPPLK